MFRLSKALALAAVATAGVLFANLAPASAANSIVEFRVKNVDATNSMMLVSAGPSYSGSLPAGTQILPGGFDPSATGFITYSAALPTVGHSTSDNIEYAQYGSGASACTFKTQVLNSAGTYQLTFSVVAGGCSAPAGQPFTSRTGDFSSTIYELDWHS
jgi:hypothetical protein